MPLKLTNAAEAYKKLYPKSRIDALRVSPFLINIDKSLTRRQRWARRIRRVRWLLWHRPLRWVRDRLLPERLRKDEWE